MKVILGADHGGFELKEKIKKWLTENKYTVLDIGAEKLAAEDDFVDYAALAAEEIGQDSEVRGLLFCRNGFGMLMVANRFRGVRCGLAFDRKAVEKGRSDDDINCLSIATDYVSEEEIKLMIEAFLQTEFSGEEKYRRRLWKLEMIGGGSCCGGGGCEGNCC